MSQRLRILDQFESKPLDEELNCEVMPLDDERDQLQTGHPASLPKTPRGLLLKGAPFAGTRAHWGRGRWGMRDRPGEYLLPMSDLWQQASEASERFGAQAQDYDRYRPRYPEGVFDDIVRVTDISQGTEAIEIGAGTGIATEPLVRRGLSVTAVEPSPEMAALTQAKLNGRGSVFVGRFEDYSSPDSFQLVASFNAWHWVDPQIAVDRVAELLAPGGWLALVWTEVVSWGEEPFEERVAQISGYPWVKRMDHVDGSMRPIRTDPGSKTVWFSITSLSARWTLLPSSR